MGKTRISADLKTVICVLMLLASACPLFAATNTSERFSPHFSADTKIIWGVPTNQLPVALWIYRRLPPRPFSAAVISNAIVLASMQDKSFPAPSTNAFFIPSPPNPYGIGFNILSLQPAATTIIYSSPDQTSFTNDIPGITTATQWAFACAARLGLDRKYLIIKDVSCVSNTDDDAPAPNGIYARGVYLSRELDGISFFGDASGGNDGFCIEFGSHGRIRSFSLVWPNLIRDRYKPTASSREIIACISAHQVIVLPDPGENTYFQRLKSLARAKIFTITKITPCYGEGVFGETPTNDVPSEVITPFAELQGIADSGTNQTTVRFISPILSSEVSHLLGKSP